MCHFIVASAEATHPLESLIGIHGSSCFGDQFLWAIPSHCASQNSHIALLQSINKAISGRSNLGPTPTSFQLGQFCLSFAVFQRIRTRSSIESTYQGQEMSWSQSTASLPVSFMSPCPHSLCVLPLIPPAAFFCLLHSHSTFLFSCMYSFQSANGIVLPLSLRLNKEKCIQINVFSCTKKVPSVHAVLNQF